MILNLKLIMTDVDYPGEVPVRLLSHYCVQVLAYFILQY